MQLTGPLVGMVALLAFIGGCCWTLGAWLTTKVVSKP
jgi:hypothetical protein